MRSASRMKTKQAERSTSDRKTGKNVDEASELVQKERDTEKIGCLAEKQRVHKEFEQPEEFESLEDRQ
mgnify:CR=1 FL=1